jgi:RHS repeat-associated protein
VLYYPYGETRWITGTLQTDFTYTGQRSEGPGLGGLMDYGARHYDPALGRFLSPDTIVPNPANPQDLNRYVYVRNNPLLYVDPSGHIGCKIGEKSTECYNKCVAGGGGEDCKHTYPPDDPGGGDGGGGEGRLVEEGVRAMWWLYTSGFGTSSPGFIRFPLSNPVRISLIGKNGISAEAATRTGTCFYSTDVSLGLAGRIESGDPRAPRLDNEGVTVPGPGGETENHLDWRASQFGHTWKLPRREANLGDVTASIRGKLGLYIGNVYLDPYFSIQSSGEVAIELPHEVTIKIEPYLRIQHTFHTIPTTAVATVATAYVIYKAAPALVPPLAFGVTQLAPQLVPQLSGAR